MKLMLLLSVLWLRNLVCRVMSGAQIEGIREQVVGEESILAAVGGSNKKMEKST